MPSEQERRRSVREEGGGSTEKDEEDISEELGALEIPRQSLHAPVAEAWSPLLL